MPPICAENRAFCPHERQKAHLIDMFSVLRAGYFAHHGQRTDNALDSLMDISHFFGEGASRACFNISERHFNANWTTIAAYSYSDDFRQ